MCSDFTPWLLCFPWCRRRCTIVPKQKLEGGATLTAYKVNETEEGEYYIAKNEAAEETHSVQSMKLTFADDSSSENGGDDKEPEFEKTTAL